MNLERLFSILQGFAALYFVAIVTSKVSLDVYKAPRAPTSFNLFTTYFERQPAALVKDVLGHTDDPSYSYVPTRSTTHDNSATRAGIYSSPHPGPRPRRSLLLPTLIGMQEDTARQNPGKHESWDMDHMVSKAPTSRTLRDSICIVVLAIVISAAPAYAYRAPRPRPRKSDILLKFEGPPVPAAVPSGRTELRCVLLRAINACNPLVICSY
jgi:hypothetical protein